MLHRTTISYQSGQEGGGRGWRLPLKKGSPSLGTQMGRQVEVWSLELRWYLPCLPLVETVSSE